MQRGGEISGDCTDIANESGSERKLKADMAQIALDLDVSRWDLERVPAAIKFGEARADGDQQIAFQQQLLSDTQAGNAAHRQRMVIWDCALAARGVPACRPQHFLQPSHDSRL